jgi:hypothetical protein
MVETVMCRVAPKPLPGAAEIGLCLSESLCPDLSKARNEKAALPPRAGEGRKMRTIAAIICVLAAMLAQQALAQQACPALAVSTNDDEVNGDTSSPCALIANPGPDGISLREALLAANNATGSGTITITFAPSLAGTTIALTERFAPITRSQITLAGLTSNGRPNITIDATNVDNSAVWSIFFVATSNFTMTGINVKNLPSNINGMQIGGFSYNFTGQMVSSPAQTCCFQISGNAFSNGTGQFAIVFPTNFSNETISDIVISNNAFNLPFEAVNLQGGGGSANGSVIQDVIISDNHFSQNTSVGTSAVELGNTSGANNTIQRVQIIQNTFTGNFQGVALDNNSTSTGSVTQNVVIARNVFAGNLAALDVAAGVDPTSANNTIANIQIVDNLVDLTGYQGGGSGTGQIFDNQSGGANNKVTNVSFVNDTIYNGSSSDPPGWGVWVNSTGGVSGVSVENTIFWGNQSNSPPLKGMTSASQVSYSIVNQAGFSGINNNLNADPLFVNASAGNFELQSGSPALHAGTNKGAPAIDGYCQPRGTPPSIGVFEFAGPYICPATYSTPLPLNATPASGHGPLAVTFHTSGLSRTKSYIINFGDGTTGPVTQHSCIGVAPLAGSQGGILCAGSASHTYAAAGTYTATLVNVSGGSLGSSVTITVGGVRPLAGGGAWWREVPAR